MYKRHALSAAFPTMSETQFADLIDDIKLNGLNEPIVLFQGEILDGWNRYQACEQAGVKPHFLNYQGTDPVQYVKSKNLFRRHLSESQRAMAIVACNQWSMPTGTMPTNVQMAEEAQVGVRTIARARTAYEAGQVEEVMSGNKSLREVEREVKGVRETVQVSTGSIEAYKKQIEDLKNEITALRDRNEELQAMAEDLTAENFMMQRILEEDERFPAALAEIKNLNDRIRIYKEQARGLQNQANEAIKLAKRANRKNARPSE
jgi:hypothetical protein